MRDAGTWEKMGYERLWDMRDAVTWEKMGYERCY